MAHYETYKKLKSLVGDEDVFVVTTDRDPVPEAPLNFGDKEQILTRYGVSINHIVKVHSLPSDDLNKVGNWRPEEVYQKFSSKHTSALLVINERELPYFSKRKGIQSNDKGMTAGISSKVKKEIKEIFEELGGNDEDSEKLKNKELWLSPDGKPQYYQPYVGNEHNLKPFEEHAYIVVIDDTKIQGKPVSTSNIRTVLGSNKYDDNKKKRFFRFVFGWFDQGLYHLMIEKFRYAHQISSETDKEKLISPTKSIKETIVRVLKKIEEDYDININDPNSSDNMTDMTSTLGQEKSDAEKSAENAKKKIDLSKQKASAERDIKGMEKDLQWKNQDILRKRKDELPQKRKELDMLNKQLSSSTTSV
jgi:hypothetical protein